MVLQNFIPEASSRGVADFIVTVTTKDQKLKTQKIPIGVVVQNGVVIGCFDRKQSSVDCIGEWLECTVACDSGTQEYSVISYERNGGEICPHKDKESRVCNTQTCDQWVASEWSACTTGTGNWSYGPWEPCQGGRAVHTSGCIGWRWCLR